MTHATQYLKNQINGYLLLVKESLKDLNRIDMNMLIRETVSYFAKDINFSSLDSRLDSNGSYDFSAIQLAIQPLQDQNLEYEYRFPNGKLVSLKDELSDIQAGLDLIKKEGQSKFGPVELGLRLNLAYDRHFRNLVRILDNAKMFQDIDELEKKVLAKISKLNEPNIFELWRQIKSEISDDPQMEKLPRDLTILGVDFFEDETNVEALKVKIAHYITCTKLKLELSSKLSAYPMAIFGIASALAISSNAEEISEREFQAFRLLIVISVLWVQDLDNDLKSFLELIGLGSNSYFANSTIRQEIEEQFKNANMNWVEVQQYLANTLKSFIDVSEDLTVQKIPFVEILKRYKLMLEVQPEYVKMNFKGFNEIAFQRHLVGHLLSLGIYSYGKKWIRSEIDLIAEDNNQLYLVEAKLFPAKSSIISSAIKKAIDQMDSYSSIEQKIEKSVLVVYNFTKVNIVPSVLSLSMGRVVLFINIGDHTPSKSDGLCRVSESKDHMIQISENHVIKSSPKKATKSKNPSRAKKPRSNRR